MVVYGHGSVEDPYKFGFEGGGCNGAGYVGCFPDKVASSIPEENQFASQSQSGGRSMFDMPTDGMLRDLSNRDNVLDGTSVSDAKLQTLDGDTALRKMLAEIPTMVKRICAQNCCEKSTSTSCAF